MRTMESFGHFWEVPESKKVVCKICFLGDESGYKYEDKKENKVYTIPSDLDNEIHNGFTIGKGKTLYWMMIWHSSGHVSVFSTGKGQNIKRRWITGDTEITIHFK